MKDLGDAMLDTLGGAIKEVTTSYQNLVDLLRAGDYERMELFDPKTLAIIRQLDEGLADQLEDLQEQARAQRDIADGIERGIDARKREERLAEIALELLEATGAKREELLAEEARLRYQVFVEQWRDVLRKHDDTIATALEKQRDTWNQYFDGIMDGWDGTLAYVRDVIMPAMQDAIAKGILPPEALQETVGRLTEQMAPEEPEMRPGWQRTLMQLHPISGLIDAIQHQRVMGDEQAVKEWEEAARELKESAQDISDAANRLSVGGVPMQHGGIVTSPTMALIGERGPEAVIPLNRLESGGGEVHIHLGNLIADEMGLRKFVRTVSEVMGQEGRRNAFGQVNKGYFYGRSSV